jgi:membrane-bound lytic murein transglycosylase D
MIRRVVCVAIGCMFGCQEADSPQLNEWNEGLKIEEYIQKSTHSIFIPAIPDKMVFADVEIPLTDWDVRERLDKELVVNSHWHSNMIFYLKRAHRWFPKMRQILFEENIPEDFLYLAVIESGLTQATSPSGAKGFWQFMEGTAKDYGLKVNDYIDERLHVEKSTRAACQYLNKAYQKLGSWFLTAAAYNRGIAGIEKDRAYQYMDDYFDLHLNLETSRYVFRMLAIKLIMESPANYGFDLPEEALYKEYNTIDFRVTSSIQDLPLWAKENGVNFKLVKLLNPWLKGKSLPVQAGEFYELLLPKKKEQLGVLGGL